MNHRIVRPLFRTLIDFCTVTSMRLQNGISWEPGKRDRDANISNDKFKRTTTMAERHRRVKNVLWMTC